MYYRRIYIQYLFCSAEYKLSYELYYTDGPEYRSEQDWPDFMELA